MNFISEWLREIVIIVLFAGFVEYLLPASSIQRYIKMTLRIIIFISLLSPLVKWIQVPNIQTFSWPNLQSSTHSFQTLPAIINQAEQLKQARESTTMLWTEQQIEEQIRQQLVGLSSRVVVRIDVSMDGTKGNEMKISRIEIRLGQSTGAQGEVVPDEEDRIARAIQAQWAQAQTKVSVTIRDG